MSRVALWDELAAKAGMQLSEQQHAKLGRYLELLLEANLTVNLTAIEDRAAAEVQHVGDALTLLGHLPAGEMMLADVGSGGGVPGLVLAIARPEAEVVLLESTKKKAVFLEKTAGALELANVRVVAERAEDAGRGRLRDACDVATARAVGAMGFVAEWCLPLVKKGGKLLAMKGAKIVEELPASERAIRLLNGGKPIVHKVELPGAENHVIVEIVKMGRTDARYPRDATIAKGKAL